MILITLDNNTFHISGTFSVESRPLIRQNPIAITSIDVYNGNFGLLVDNIWLHWWHKLMWAKSSMRIRPEWGQIECFREPKYSSYISTSATQVAIWAEFSIRQMRTPFEHSLYIGKQKIQLLNSVNFSKNTFICVWLCVCAWVHLNATVRMMVGQ